MVQVSKRLVIKKEIPLDISKDLINSLDTSLAEYYCDNKDFMRGLKILRETLPNLAEAEREQVVQKYLADALNYAKLKVQDKKWTEALDIYREIMKFSGVPPIVYKYIGICMKNLGKTDTAMKFFKQFELISPDKEDIYIYLADITYSDIKDNFKAIEYYEKALERDKNNFSLYNMLGHLYSTCYQDKYKEKQLEYLNRAYELAPNNRVVVKNLAYVYGKFHDTEKADEFYSKLLGLNPTHSDLHAYGAYLVKHERFTEGFKYLQHRFQKEDCQHNSFPSLFSNKKKRWNPKVDIKNKRILVHYEQGFGDSIMFVRFVREIKSKCAKVSLAVQNSLVSLFKDSDLGVDIYSESEIANLNYDYYIPMMDLPLICGTRPDTIPYAAGYLNVPQAKIIEYKKEYINNNPKLKIGIAYEGTLASKETDRDIPLEFLYPLMLMPEVEVYSFQVNDLTNQMDRIPAEANLIRLGQTFKNWEDTACAMKSMDLIVTTDNGVMNLAGALGVKTFALFNKVTEWRWFQTEGKDIVWYKSVKPFQAPTAGAWEVPVAQIIEEIQKIQCQRIARRIKGL